MMSGDTFGKTAADEIIVGVVWAIGALVVGIFGGMLIEIGSCDL